MNIRKGHTPFELLFHKKPNLGNLIRFGSDVLVKPPQQSVSKVNNKMNVICGTFLGNSADSNCYKVWIRSDMKFRIYLTTNVKPLKTFRYLWQSLKSLSAHPSDPRANTTGIPSASEGSFRPSVTVIGNGQLPKASPNALKVNIDYKRKEAEKESLREDFPFLCISVIQVSTALLFNLYIYNIN